MCYSGLAPSEHSSGGSHRRGSITHTGNAHLRRVIVEAAWHYRLTPRVSAVLKKRQEGVPEDVKAIAYNAQHRLNLKYRRMMAKEKPQQKVVIELPPPWWTPGGYARYSKRGVSTWHAERDHTRLSFARRQ